RMRIGPNIADPTGAQMDENGNRTNGESSDAYPGEFEITLRNPAALPLCEGFESGPVGLSSWSFVTFDGVTEAGTISVGNTGPVPSPWLSCALVPYRGSNCLSLRTPP